MPEHLSVLTNSQESVDQLTVKEPDPNIQPSTEGLFDPVKELDPYHYAIKDFPFTAFSRRCQREYNTSKLNHLMEAIGISGWLSNTFVRNCTIKIHKFFIPEILYLLEKFGYSRTLRSNIEQYTWIGNPPSHATTFDYGRIAANMDCKLLAHQEEFVKSYATKKDSAHLRGWLLSFEQGLGKTITSIALMEGMAKEHVFVICPKNTMLETWNAHLEKFFKKKQSVYITGVTKEYTGQRWLIFNYDAMNKLEEILHSQDFTGAGFIVDESHNFLRSQAERTQRLVKIATAYPDTDILMQSGTPLKCAGVEMIPLMQVLDPLFNDEAVATFKKAFGLNTVLAADILHNRLMRMMTRVTKDVLTGLPPKTESVVKVKMPTGRQYTASAVKKAIVEYTIARKKYHEEMMPTYKSEWKECVRWMDFCYKDLEEYRFWRQRVEQLIEEGGYFESGDPTITRMNEIEKNVLEPGMPKDIRDKFRHCKAAIKYLRLKIRGEVLGQCLGGLRMKMTSELMQASPILTLVEEAEKKTLVFTSFVETIELCEKFFVDHGYKPIAIYGKTSGMLAQLVKTFMTDPSYNPLVASLQTLATGATLTAANRVIFLNKPWRSIDYQQASDRVHRIGQDCEVSIISIILDTGDEPNLSTRMEDIMTTSAEIFDAIVGGKPMPVPEEGVESLESWLPEDCQIGIDTPKTEVQGDRAVTPSLENWQTEIVGVESLNERQIMEKKKKIISRICEICDIIDPSKLNSERYHRLLDHMNAKEFHEWMLNVQNKKWILHIVAPNMKVNLHNRDLLKAADAVHAELFHRIWMVDDNTGREYLTENPYLILPLPIRRQQQFLDEKISVPEDDSHIDGMTGQVTGDSKATQITNPEVNILASRGLDSVLKEMVNVRGGNNIAYGEFKRQAEETGEVSLNMLDPNSRSRTAIVGQVFLRAMHIDNNLV